MNNYQIIFSPTGGTEKVANAITQTWSQVNTIDLSVPDINYKNIAHGNEDKTESFLFLYLCRIFQIKFKISTFRTYRSMNLT